MDANELVSFLGGLQPGELVTFANSSGTFVSTYRSVYQGRVVSGLGRDDDPLDAVEAAKSVVDSRK